MSNTMPARTCRSQYGEEIDLVVQHGPQPQPSGTCQPGGRGMARAAGTFADKPGAPRHRPHLAARADPRRRRLSRPGHCGRNAQSSRACLAIRTGGTIHIIANNQVGFTTDPQRRPQHALCQRPCQRLQDSRSSMSMPMIRWPVSRRRALAMAYRNHFQRDFLIDLIGYRRYGHNEGDEPRFTQPMLYADIEARPLCANCGRDVWSEQHG